MGQGLQLDSWHLLMVLLTGQFLSHSVTLSVRGPGVVGRGREGQAAASGDLEETRNTKAADLPSCYQRAPPDH